MDATPFLWFQFTSAAAMQGLIGSVEHGVPSICAFYWPRAKEFNIGAVLKSFVESLCNKWVHCDMISATLQQNISEQTST